LVTQSASRRKPDSCTSPASTQKTATSNTKRKQKSKKRKVHVIESDNNGSDDLELDHSSAQAPVEIDIVQDSDQENSKFICKKNKKQKKEKLFDEVEEYFEKPMHANDNVSARVIHGTKSN
jgi:hypothetical protein